MHSEDDKGAMVSFYFPSGSSGDLQQDTASLIRQLQQNNPGMRAQGRSRRTSLDRREALVTTLESQSPYQEETEVDMLVTVSTREGLFYVLFIAPESEYRQVQGVHEKMLSSVRLSI